MTRFRTNPSVGLMEYDAGSSDAQWISELQARRVGRHALHEVPAFEVLIPFVVSPGRRAQNSMASYLTWRRAGSSTGF